jgi:DNA-binding protein HU-beta
MNRSDLVDVMAKELDQAKSDCDRFLSAFISTVSTNLKKKEEVKIVGFGTFKTVKRKARLGRNPQTGKELKIAARTVPVFKAGEALKKIVK